jgi:hypothetical protein
MASLGEKVFKVYPADTAHEPFKFKSRVAVDHRGEFSFTIPDELIATAKANAKLQAVKLCGVGWTGRGSYTVTGLTKNDCEQFLQKVMHDYLACTVTKETVIAYATEARVHYWKKADGEIVPNGVFDHEYDQQGGTWGGPLDRGGMKSFKSFKSFGVGLGARCFTKITEHRLSGDQVSYAPTYGDGDHFSKDTYLQKLGQFVHLDIDPAHAKQIPYTEDAAKFFYDAMISLCKLSDRIEGFFESPDCVQKAIEAKAGFFLTSGGK